MFDRSTNHVFISYSRRDNEKVQEVVSCLREQGINIWLDNEKLAPGTPAWETEIEKAISGAFAIVVVLSPDSKASEWVLREITLADTLEKRLFPILVKGDNKNSIPFRLITNQYVDIRSNETEGLNSLTKALARYIEESSLTGNNYADNELSQAEAERKAKEAADLLAVQKRRVGGMAQSYTKLFGNLKPQLITPDDDSEAKRLRIAQKNNDWRTVENFFSQLTDPDDREFYVAQLSEWKGRPDFFDIWVNANPECSDAWLLRGAHGVVWAWEARGGGTADTVSDTAWILFYERLMEAKYDLEHATRLNPTDPAPYSALIRCSIGLSLEKETVLTYLTSVLSLSTISWSAHAAALTYLCEKWGGSHREMFEFARSVSAAAPEGHGIHALIPMAHHERWFFAKYFDEGEGTEFADRYYEQPEVQREILNAYNRSLGSSAYRPNKLTPKQSSLFAIGLVQCGAYEQALLELERLNNRIPELPWAQFGDPIEFYTRIKSLTKSVLGVE